MSNLIICDWCGEPIEKDQESIKVEINITGAFEIKKSIDLHGKGIEKEECAKKYEKELREMIFEEPSKYR